MWYRGNKEYYNRNNIPNRSVSFFFCVLYGFIYFLLL
jgi:hypothetical protein